MTAAPDVFVLGIIDDIDYMYIHDYIAFYQRAGIHLSRIILAIRSQERSDDYHMCKKALDAEGILFYQEIDQSQSAAEWRQAIQDECVQDQDWVVHSDIRQRVYVPWTDNDIILAAHFLDHSQFDAVIGTQYSRYATSDIDTSQDLWPQHTLTRNRSEAPVVMTRGYWYVCDDAQLCPEFQDSAWIFNKRIQVHEYVTGKTLMDSTISGWHEPATRVS